MVKKNFIDCSSTGSQTSDIDFREPVSIAKKCFDIWSIFKMVPVKSVELGNNSFSINEIIRCRSKLLLLGVSKFVLVLIL